MLSKARLEIFLKKYKKGPKIHCLALKLYTGPPNCITGASKSGGQGGTRVPGAPPGSASGYSFLQLTTSCEVELSTRELFTNECIIVKMSTEGDEVVRKPARAAEMSTTIVKNNAYDSSTEDHCFREVNDTEVLTCLKDFSGNLLFVKNNHLR